MNQLWSDESIMEREFNSARKIWEQSANDLILDPTIPTIAAAITACLKQSILAITNPRIPHLNRIYVTWFADSKRSNIKPKVIAPLRLTGRR